MGWPIAILDDRGWSHDRIVNHNDILGSTEVDTDSTGKVNTLTRMPHRTRAARYILSTAFRAWEW